MSWETPDAYQQHLDATAIVPQGFHFFRQQLVFSPPERPGAGPYRMNLSFLHSDGMDTVGAAVSTRNRYPGAPVLLLRERNLPGPLRGILVNNKVANVASPGGLEHARALAAAAAQTYRLPEQQVLSVSTGVIGWALPVTEMQQVLVSLPSHQCSPRQWAEAIMTTDRYPKMACGRSRDTHAAMLGIAKGAGMIEPDMATMLAFFVTDGQVSPEVLQRVLARVSDRSFNALSVDGDQSTSDMVLAMANGLSGEVLEEAALERLWQPLADSLAMEIVRNGEGTAHVLELTIRGVPDRRFARNVGRHVINSPLVKTAIHGNDPNIGRILGALGSALSRYDSEGTVDPRNLTMTLAGTEVFRGGAFQIDAITEKTLSDAMVAAAMDPTVRGFPQLRGTVPIVLDFNGPDCEDVRVIGSDLSYEYIRENADYRT